MERSASVEVDDVREAGSKRTGRGSVSVGATSSEFVHIAHHMQQQ